MKYAFVPFIALLALVTGCAAEEASSEESPVRRNDDALMTRYGKWGGSAVIFDAAANGGPLNMNGCNVWNAWEGFSPDSRDSTALGTATLSGDLMSCARVCQQWVRPYTREAAWDYSFDVRHLYIYPDSLDPKTGRYTTYQYNPVGTNLVDRYECVVRDIEPTYTGATCFPPQHDAPRDPKKAYLDPVESEGAICDLQSKQL